MSKRWVIDSSVAIAWVHPGQATVHTDALLRDLQQGVVLLVPSLWFVETANALLILERRKKLSRTDRLEALSRLGALNPKPDDGPTSLAFSKISEIAEARDLSVYDATYLELAMRENLPLGTKDGPLCAAAKACNLQLLLG